MGNCWIRLIGIAGAVFATATLSAGTVSPEAAEFLGRFAAQNKK